MDRLLIDFSMDGSGPLTRSLDNASTSGFIRDDAAHWSIEPFIPLHATTLIEYLLSRNELTESGKQRFAEFCPRIDKILYERTSSYHTHFSSAYLPLDPDTDNRDPLVARLRELSKQDPDGEENVSAPAAVGSEQITDVIQLCESILEEAGYRRLTQADIEQCVGVASQWGVPLHVDFDLFKRLVVYARGDIVGTRLRRRLRKMYRRESVTVPIYQRMVVLFQLHAEDLSEEKLAASALHLRMFKNIPKQDIDMLLPGTRIRISGVDHVKIILPSLGGFLMSIRKIAQYALLFAAIALHWTAILVALVVGYLVKSVLSYFQTKNRYQLNLTKNLYFQKLDTNAGVAYRMIQQAHRQSSVEAILAYHAILASDHPISTRKLRRRCERVIREAVDVEVDFQVDRAIARLLDMKVIAAHGEHWRAT